MTKKYLKLISILSLVSILLLFCAVGVSAKAELPTSSYAFGKFNFSDVSTSYTNSQGVVKGTKRDYSNLKLYVGGMPFGVKFLTDGVIVVGFDESLSENPAKNAGIRCNDVIISIDGRAVISADTLNAAVEGSVGKPITVKYSRNGKEQTAQIKPRAEGTDGRYTIGIYVRDSGAGIGTLTFICPTNNAFGGLGHGICDAESGRLIPMQRGSVVGVKINGIVKGLSGSPGEVKGYFNSGKTGTLLGNTDCGVYGALASIPKEVQGEPMSLGLRDSVKSGRAYIYTMLDDTRVEKYEIEISQIDRQSTTNKCFAIKVTDARLLNKTGGIIQGMSGSPIVQNGKLIGAVTHVLINDPTSGYGIFIENMLDQMGDLID